MTSSVIALLIVASLLKIIPTCMPTGVVNWLLSKFETHLNITPETSEVYCEQHRIDGEEKTKLIDSFNHAIFMKKYYIYPGTENKYINEYASTEKVHIKTKLGKKDAEIFLAKNNRSIDVLRIIGKKVVAYNIDSNDLLGFCMDQNMKQS